MKKDMLKTGMRVRMRNGQVYLVIKDIQHVDGHEELAFISELGFMKGSNYDDDLTNKYGYSNDYDVMEVYLAGVKPKSLLNSNTFDLDKRHSIWKREEYSEEQKTILRALKVLGYNYVARQQSYYLYGYLNKPIKEIEYWRSHYISVQLPNDVSEILDFIKWEDKEPFEIPKV